MVIRSFWLRRTQWVFSTLSGGRREELPSYRKFLDFDSSLLPRLMHQFQYSVEKSDDGSDLIEEMKNRFLRFKRCNYLKEFEYFQNLSEAQSPKVMVIACADSRVCPSHILGFRPGEALTVRNVANLVPPRQKGPSETNAALEFAVKILQVKNILIVGHSNCGGIQALMSMPDEQKPLSCLERWITVAGSARARTREAQLSGIGFDQQCRHCEKESINLSMKNLLTYPWIEERVRKELLYVHGGYYDLSNCTFERWRLHIDGSKDWTREVWS